jgi:NAD(P)-dependent dehydrogenase (short-subunit alcohol dehydrogenase family)
VRGRTALVTGANRGIGFETARQLAELGLDVILTARDAHAGHAAAAELGVSFRQLDVASDESVERCARTLRADGFHIDVLVNNAAVFAEPRGITVLGVEPDVLRETLEVNLIGALRTIRAFVPPMVERRWGRVVNVTSRAGLLGRVHDKAPGYGIAKAGLNQLTRRLAVAVEGTGVLVNAVDPGPSRTRMKPDGTTTAAEAADSIVWAATLPDDGPTNCLFLDRTPIEW